VFDLKRNGLGPNQKKILELLTAYPDSTIMETVRLLSPGQQIKYGGKQYNSTCRSFHMLAERGLIEKEGGQIKWHIKPKSP
jgi:hypothetical protein